MQLGLCFHRREKLNRKVPLGEIPRLNGLEHVPTVKVLIRARKLDGFHNDVIFQVLRSIGGVIRGRESGALFGAWM